jgi:hypothetical protein
MLRDRRFALGMPHDTDTVRAPMAECFDRTVGGAGDCGVKSGRQPIRENAEVVVAVSELWASERRLGCACAGWRVPACSAMRVTVPPRTC